MEIDILSPLLVERGAVIGELLPYIIGVAISPVPIIAVILMLFTPNARTVAPAFAAGWLLALLLVGAIVMYVADAGDASTDQGSSDTVFVIKLLLGLIFVFLAYRQWQSRPKEGAEPEMPVG